MLGRNIFVKERETAQEPTRKYRGDAGYDLHACLDESPLAIRPFRRATIPTGVSLNLPFAWAAFIQERSGMAREKGVCTIGNVIDGTYKGELYVILANLSDETITIYHGERIAQLVPFPRWIDWRERDLPQRGTHGFGSTGA